jgi:hypothetical protein
MAKYKDWIAIKRMGIREGTKPEEIVYHLAGIRNTLDARMYKMLGIDTALLDAAAESVSNGLRKGYGSLSQAISGLGSAEARGAVENACAANKALGRLAETYLLGKVITNLGYDTSINQLQLSKIFPELKPPKAPGRRKKQ